MASYDRIPDSTSPLKKKIRSMRMPQADRQKSFHELVTIIEKLRGKGGCPWDRKQTAASLKKYLLEESAELAEAIEREDSRHICEETGDLLYILILLTLIHEENGRFDLHDVLAGIAEKMIRRHPHVFAGGKTGNTEELRRQWQQIKEEEKKGD
jgi:tetrapyrrole methylase family protein / MazG family protein